MAGQPNQIELGQTPDVARRPLMPGRLACTAVSIVYFSLLWLVGTRHGLAVPAIATVIYLYLTVDRWGDIQIGNLSAIQMICLIFWADHDTSPLVQFGVIAPAVLLCVAPSGIGRTGPQLQIKINIGRTAYILAMLPAVVLMATQYWLALNRVIAEAWSLVAAPIDRVDPAATMAVAILMTCILSDLRLRDIGAWKRLSIAVYALLLIRGLALILSVDRSYVTALDLFLAACVFALCLWPSRAADA